jgi:protein-S-isoprenylcysteine O-methyltransferase Ste14
MTKNIQNNKAFKRSFWIAFAFYFLIGFEFFYMISPFAAYFYTVYQPGLEFLNDSTTLAWLSSIFLPHIVIDTRSGLLNALADIGMILTFGGFGIFCIGAGQVYYSKLIRKKAVTGGVYNWVRHPQYAALMITGFGMLILWPRYITLLSYITMLFLYYFLARVEEKECETKFGKSYVEYKNKTTMFLPFSKHIFEKVNIFPAGGISKYLALIAFYLFVCVMGIGIANQIREWALTNLYTRYDDHSATIATVKVDQSKMDLILDIAYQDQTVKQRLDLVNYQSIKSINYIVPFDYSASEIPMHQMEEGIDHFSYKVDKNLIKYKIIFTRSISQGTRKYQGIDIIASSKDRIPLLEVYVDIKKLAVYKIEDPVKNDLLESVPLPVF